MSFYRQPQDARAAEIARIMTESAMQFTHCVTAKEYFDLYETMLKRPIISAV